MTTLYTSRLRSLPLQLLMILGLAAPAALASGCGDDDGSDPIVDAGPDDGGSDAGEEPVKPADGITFVNVNSPVDLTPDGKTALLWDYGSPAGDLYFYNTETTQLDLKTDLGITVLMVEHDMSLVNRVSDRVIALNYGRVIAMGSPSEVQGHPDVVAAYLGG